MSTVVYQQNQASIYEPHLAETKLKLRVTPPPTNAELGGWGFLQKESSTMINKDFPYTHPLSKNSKLSPKSLQLCTENLGSESGSDTFSDCSSIFSASPPLSPTSDDRRAARIPPPTDRYCRKINNFPPPLTTMSGASSLQVRRRSDGGRLILDAVEGPFRNSYLHAERSDGRLKLSFAAAACNGGDDEEEEECGAAETAEGEIEGNGNGFESELDVEMNVLERIQRFRRCNSHGSKGLCTNWKPSTLWVATS